MEMDQQEQEMVDFLMEKYNEAVMEVDDPREITINEADARKAAETAAKQATISQVAAKILQTELMSHMVGREPSPWFREMMKMSPSDYIDSFVDLAESLGIDVNAPCDCDNCQSDEDDSD